MVFLGMCSAVAGKDGDSFFTSLVQDLMRKIDRELSLRTLTLFPLDRLLRKIIAATKRSPMRLRSSVGRPNNGEHCLMF
jgi:hypothetical protein